MAIFIWIYIFRCCSHDLLIVRFLWLIMYLSQFAYTEMRLITPSSFPGLLLNFVFLISFWTLSVTLRLGFIAELPVYSVNSRIVLNVADRLYLPIFMWNQLYISCTRFVLLPNNRNEWMNEKLYMAHQPSAYKLPCSQHHTHVWFHHISSWFIFLLQ